jgi:hypothetical protein
MPFALLLFCPALQDPELLIHIEWSKATKQKLPAALKRIKASMQDTP